jgi:hypothetical protein
MPRHDRREGRFVAPGCKPVQKLRIGETRRAPLCKQSLNLLENSPESSTGHDADPSF